MLEFHRIRKEDVFQELPFSPNLSEPVDRWLQFRMGWDVQFVDWIIREYSTPDTALIIDPFCGAGATLVSSVRNKRAVIGIDCDPVAVVSSYAKTHFHHADDLSLGILLLLKSTEVAGYSDRA